MLFTLIRLYTQLLFLGGSCLLMYLMKYIRDYLLFKNFKHTGIILPILDSCHAGESYELVSEGISNVCVDRKIIFE
jgi:hypothetical protein